MIDLNLNDTFAVYSLPRIQDYYLIHGQKTYVDTISDKEGFVVSPFNPIDSRKILISKENELKNPPFDFQPSEKPSNRIISKIDYLSTLDAIIDDLNKGERGVEKLVFSRVIEKKIKEINVYNFFLKLVDTYPDAFVFLYHIPGEGCWMGASPEKLLSWKGDIVQTASLASTKSIHDLSEWSDKDIAEQAIVTHYIEAQLRDLALTYTKENYVKMAGPVKHLCTQFDIVNRVDVDILLGRIHPTPAICGYPYLEALQAIHHYESHDRKHYCGFLGPLNGRHTGDLFVNLRSMHLGRDMAHIYVGGGIIKECDPNKEWQETLLKADTLLSILDTVYI